MYLPNKYTIWYNSIIAQSQGRVNLEGYYENHHIIPKSLGGLNTADNIVKLTAKEHFICHRLLTKMTAGLDKMRMTYAAWQLTHLNGRPRYKPSARTYQILKKQISETRKGLRMSEEQKQKLRKPKTEEHKQKLRKPKTEEHKKSLSLSRTGKSWGHKHSEKTKAKMSSWQKGIPKPKVTCEYCKKETSLVNNIRWHGNNCKSYVNMFCANSLAL